jgi:hypothetical protein
MNLRLIKQLENAAQKLRSTPDYCEHTFAEIIFPDNQAQTFAPCFRCSKPRLVSVLRYEDGRTMPRTLQAARSAFVRSAERFPEHSEAERRAAIAKAFGIDEKLL